MKLVQRNGRAPVNGAAADTLLKTIARGNALWQRLQSENASVTELAKVEGMTLSYLTRVLRLALLYPWIVEQIIAGRQPATLDARKLTLSGELPMRWDYQRAFAGFSATRQSLTVSRKMAEEKTGLFGPTLLSGDVLLVRCGSLRGAELRAFSKYFCYVSST